MTYEAMEAVDIRHTIVNEMRLQKFPLAKIAEVTGLSVGRCSNIHNQYLRERRAQLAVAEHIDQQYVDIEKALDIYRALMFGEPLAPDIPINLNPKDTHDLFWKGIAAKAKLLGLDAPSQTHVMHEDLTETNDEAAEFVAELAAWARRTNAINVGGFNPALPPGMTERPVPVASNGHGKIHGSTMWSMACEFPSDDDGLDADGL